ncbi:4-aminobutyrate--2-oxoglutarate transaminase [Alicyclobacillus fastidiosus]|uniref:(S)-3-amino-2-methylpropionate transaminase n=1 Tax=Alicyclobacillus fastidiosus TaxID=392011 RepID=A0ABY6ZCF3_9BACL|nr:4-aminobutyrate--2-oxoglutarate transaminase [Alicyclobacillus fastidiosus]WAH40524.1 4-aminobutyrate--2-oxoglutarate transaminase [Alicyclobacillus fastidiosus]
MDTQIIASKSLLQLHSQYVPKGVSVQNKVVITRAQGARMWDEEGNEYLDFAGGIGVLNVGNAQPEIVQVVSEQAQKLFHTCIHVTLNEPYLRLVEQLCNIAPIDGEKKALLLNSGAEAVENAIKVAKSYTGRSAVIAFESAFHGRTTLGLSLTSKVHPYKAKFGPFVPEVYRLPFPNLYRKPEGQSAQDFIDESIATLQRAFDTYVNADDVAAIIIEPVQGEGGFVVAPPRYMQALRDICTEHGIVFIVDEIQTGFARTGKLFATEHYEGLNPDIITMAKSMGAGLPISAVVGRPAILDSTEVGGLGGTYGGNPLAAAASLKVIEIMERDELASRAQQIGEKSVAMLSRLQERIPFIGDVRGLGAMVGVEFVRDSASKEPYPELVALISQKCFEKRLVTVKAGVYSNVIRLLCPLVITDEELEEGLARLESAITEAVAELS